MAYTPKFAALIAERQAFLRTQLDAYVPTTGSFVWEIGCGHGHFLTAFASAHPDQVCLGIDLVSERIARAQRKRDRAKLVNLHFLQAEARLFLDTLPPGPRISRVFVLFPDPWPKLRHNKHRILQPLFLANLARHVVRDCPLYFRTDHADYFAATREVLAHDPHWKVVEEPWPFEFATVFQQRAPSFQSLVARCKVPDIPANSVGAVRNPT